MYTGTLCFSWFDTRKEVYKDRLTCTRLAFLCWLVCSLIISDLQKRSKASSFAWWDHQGRNPAICNRVKWNPPGWWNRFFYFLKYPEKIVISYGLVTLIRSYFRRVLMVVLSVPCLPISPIVSFRQAKNGNFRFFRRNSDVSLYCLNQHI